MARSFFPTTDASLSVWLNNYKTKIGLYGTAFTLTQQEIDAETKECDDLIALINQVNGRRTDLKSAINAKNEGITTVGGLLRANIGRHKMAVGFTEAMGQDLGIISHSAAMDFANYKPKIVAELFGGFIRIKFKKMGTEGINLYHRKKGTSNWEFVARATKSPFDHHIKLEVVNQPEHWEYRCFGMVDDAEVGIASDIIEVIFGG
jgi:hypothetical protein